MKKTYLQPSLKEVRINTCNLLAGSIPAGGYTDQNLAPALDDLNW